MFGKLVKKLFGEFGCLCPQLATRFLFKKYLGYKLDLDNPKTLNEKMQYLKLNTYNNHPLVTQCADKYRVRDYVKQCGCGDILVPLLGVWNNADEIDFEKLPDKFVIKCNHGSGTNIICRQKNKLDFDSARKKLNNWLGKEFGKQRVELIYHNIERRIIAESFIETEGNKAPNDYKIYCTYGSPKFVLVASDRSDELKFDYFTIDWKWIPVKCSFCPNALYRDSLRPALFEKMLEYASILSRPFPLVRVDFYFENGQIYFGEITFLDGGGLSYYDPIKYDRILGDMINSDITKGIIQ